MPPEWWVDFGPENCQMFVIPFHPPDTPVESDTAQRLRNIEHQRASEYSPSTCCCWLYLLHNKNRDGATERNQIRTAGHLECVATNPLDGRRVTLCLDDISFPMNTPLTSAKGTEHVVGFATYTIKE